MGVTVRKSPAVKLFDGWFDERTYFKLKNAPIKAVEDYDDKVKRLIEYSTNAKYKKHYQHYEKQYQDYTEKHSKLKLDSL
eukprot:8156831-Ditylum_brightwellii.AAC.1